MTNRTVTRAELEQLVVDAITITDERTNWTAVPEHKREQLLTVAARASAVLACKSAFGRCACPAVMVERLTDPGARMPYGCGDFPAAFDLVARRRFGAGATADGVRLVVA